mgnify:CR=1 FL=1
MNQKTEFDDAWLGLGDLSKLEIDKNPISEDITNSVLNWFINQSLEG